MANCNPSPRTRFQRGKSGNNRGRPRLLPELKKLSTVNRNHLARILCDHAYKTRQQLEIAIADPDTTVLDLAVATVLMKAIESGDAARLEWLLSRAIGKVRCEVQVAATRPYIIERIKGEHCVELGSIEVDQSQTFTSEE